MAGPCLWQAERPGPVVVQDPGDASIHNMFTRTKEDVYFMLCTVEEDMMYISMQFFFSEGYLGLVHVYKTIASQNLATLCVIYGLF